MNHRSNRRMRSLGMLLVILLLVAPAAQASQEDTQEAAAKAASQKKGAETKPECAAKNEDGTAKATDRADRDARCSEEQKAATHPSFNTIEDVVAYRGNLAALWVATAPQTAAVEWREIEPERKDVR